MSDSVGPHGLCPWNLSGQNTGGGLVSPSQDLPDPRNNRGLFGSVRARAILQTSFLGRGGAWGLQTFCILSAWLSRAFLACLGFF